MFVGQLRGRFVVPGMAAGPAARDVLPLARQRADAQSLVVGPDLHVGEQGDAGGVLVRLGAAQVFGQPARGVQVGGQGAAVVVAGDAFQFGDGARVVGGVPGRASGRR
jgi:hypothetical protein